MSTEPLAGRDIHFPPHAEEGGPRENPAGDSLPSHPESPTGHSLPRHPEEPAKRASRRTHNRSACFETRPGAAPQHDAGGVSYVRPGSPDDARGGPISSAAASRPAPFVAIEHARYRYGAAGPAIVDGVDWAIPRGAIHCLLGRSGCGKTTLLKLAAGLLLPSEGAIRMGGEVLRGPGARIGFVFQAPTLLDWLSALDNVLLPVSLKRRPQARDHDAALELLALVGLADHAGRRPPALSGGQQSRIALARALMGAPDLLLFDEPFAALDALTREELHDDLLRLCALRGSTALFVTHDIAEAVYLGDEVAVMAAGRIAHARRIDLPRPRHRDMRYAPAFGAACRALRDAMDRAGLSA